MGLVVQVDAVGWGGRPVTERLRVPAGSGTQTVQWLALNVAARASAHAAGLRLAPITVALDGHELHPHLRLAEVLSNLRRGEPQRNWLCPPELASYSVSEQASVRSRSSLIRLGLDADNTSDLAPHAEAHPSSTILSQTGKAHLFNEALMQGIDLPDDVKGSANSSIVGGSRLDLELPSKRQIVRSTTFQIELATTTDLNRDGTPVVASSLWWCIAFGHSETAQQRTIHALEQRSADAAALRLKKERKRAEHQLISLLCQSVRGADMLGHRSKTTLCEFLEYRLTQEHVLEAMKEEALVLRHFLEESLQGNLNDVDAVAALVTRASKPLYGAFRFFAAREHVVGEQEFVSLEGFLQLCTTCKFAPPDLMPVLLAVIRPVVIRANTATFVGRKFLGRRPSSLLSTEALHTFVDQFEAGQLPTEIWFSRLHFIEAIVCLILSPQLYSETVQSSTDAAPYEASPVARASFLLFQVFVPNIDNALQLSALEHVQMDPAMLRHFADSFSVISWIADRAARGNRGKGRSGDSVAARFALDTTILALQRCEVIDALETVAPPLQFVNAYLAASDAIAVLQCAQAPVAQQRQPSDSLTFAELLSALCHIALLVQFHVHGRDRAVPSESVCVFLQSLSRMQRDRSVESSFR